MTCLEWKELQRMIEDATVSELKAMIIRINKEIKNCK